MIKRIHSDKGFTIQSNNIETALEQALEKTMEYYKQYLKRLNFHELDTTTENNTAEYIGKERLEAIYNLANKDIIQINLFDNKNGTYNMEFTIFLAIRKGWYKKDEEYRYIIGEKTTNMGTEIVYQEENNVGTGEMLVNPDEIYHWLEKAEFIGASRKEKNKSLKQNFKRI